MYLKRLELIGFKSFADRTELEFVPGVTAVVGPNGSGKSNVSDAIRWVLGEQSAKSLRGAKMEDIIFAGSDTRKPVNFAEVSLTLDNSDRTLDLEYAEVTVTRRVYRSGESEYSINKRPCRLKDIMELFMDTGVGKEAYSIIGQGRIEEILSTKPEDRRGIFEEAAGIVKYKNRKREAEKKLEETEQNLVRIHDIISEIHEQIGPLREQAETAKTYKRLKQELLEQEVALYVLRIEATHAKWQEAKNRVEELKAQLAGLSADASTFEANLEQARLQVNEIDLSIAELQQALLQVSEETEKAEGRREVLKERERNLQANRGQTMEQMHRMTEKRRMLEGQLDSEQKRLEAARERKTAAEASLAEAESSYARKLQSLADDVDKLKSDYFEMLNEMASLRNGIRHEQQLKDSHRVRMERLLAEKDRLEQEDAERRRKQEEIRQTLAEMERTIQQTLAEYRTLSDTVRERQEQAEAAKQELQRCEQKREAAKSRLELIKDMQNEFAGFQQGVKEVLKARGRVLDGIHGAVAELIKVPEKVETAIEVALGAALQNVVVTDEAAGREAIAYLKKHNLGRATFLPLTVIRPRVLPANDRRLVEREPGVVGIASELVHFDEAYRAIVESLLGHVIVTETLEQANNVARTCGYRYRVVTLEGDLVNAGGSMTGGALKKQTANLLGRSRQAEELEAYLAEMTKAAAACSAEIGRLQAEAAELAQKQEQLRSAGETLRVREQEAKSLLNQTEADGRRVSERLAIVNQDLEGYQLEMDRADRVLREMEERLQRLAAEEQRLQTTIAEAEAKRQEQLADREELNQRITDLKVAAAQAAQEHESRLERVERLRQEIEALGAEWEEANRSLSQWEEQAESIQAASAELEQLIAQLRKDKERISELISERRARRADLAVKLEEAELAAKETRNRVKTLEEALHQEEVKANRYDVELEHLLGQLSAEYQLSFDLAREKYPPRQEQQQLQQTVSRLKEEIGALGSVNLGAIEEYERLSERLSFLSGQEEDLNQAKEMLYQVIAEMDGEMSKRFQQTFRDIREQFQSVFVQLFGGGRADLLLSQPDNLLETGIDIVAQPPGKKLQNLALLSGGERALTAMALLFAILRVKPVPFCVLDEVEAALDEANVTRFAEYMRQFSSETQFICVTHRKGTMESADVLYGITMQEDGVSKLVSVRLEDSKTFMESVS